jgi:hypothetical protein
MSHDKIGNVLAQQGNLPAALESYRASLAIKVRLAKFDPGDALKQRALALVHGLIAILLAEQGAKTEATAAYKQGHAIIKRLVQQSPDNADLRTDLASFEDALRELKNEASRAAPAQPKKRVTPR